MKTDYIKFKDAEYVMPFLFGNDLFIPILDILFKNEKNPIKYVYGAPKCAWSGGRVSNFILKEENVEEHIKKLSKYNILAQFTFSNLSITDEMLNSEYCNNILDIASKYNSQIILGSEKLLKHIKSRYKNIKTVCTIILPSSKFTEQNFNETNFYKSLLKQYDTIVVRPEWVIENSNEIKKLISEPERIEILVNHYCTYNCQYAKKHYNLTEQLEHDQISREYYEKEVKKMCAKYTPLYRKTLLDKQTIDKVLEQGVKLIKIQGRSCSFDTVYNELYEYFFNSKYSKEEIREKIDTISAKLIQNSRKAAFTII